jgi:hypothetical protein
MGREGIFPAHFVVTAETALAASAGRERVLMRRQVIARLRLTCTPISHIVTERKNSHGIWKAARLAL